MIEEINALIFRYRDHLRSLKYGLSDAEDKFLNNVYSLRAFINIIEGHIRVGSAPIINKKKLFDKYIIDFCKRHGCNNVKMQNQIRNYKNKFLPEFNGEWYYSDININQNTNKSRWGSCIAIIYFGYKLWKDAWKIVKNNNDNSKYKEIEWQKILLYNGVDVDDKVRGVLTIMSLLNADQLGLLGSDKDRFMSINTKKIVKTYFDITLSSQFELDTRIIINYWDTTPEEGLKRIAFAIWRAIIACISWNQLYNPNFCDNTLDHDAFQFIRGIIIRGIITVLSAISELLRVFFIPKYFIPINGLENIPLSFVVRIAVRAFLISLVGGFDNLPFILVDSVLLLVPPFISVWFHVIINNVVM